MAQQIKTSTKLSENTLYDKPTTNTSSKTTNTITINNNACVCKTCRLCKHDVAIFAYSEGSPYCPDCEKALGEIITWWNGNARKWWRNKEQEIVQEIAMGTKESVMGSVVTVRPLIKY
nr:MAG TPA: TFIIB zinc-binding [Caudoviricetes sp.]